MKPIFTKRVEEIRSLRLSAPEKWQEIVRGLAESYLFQMLAGVLYGLSPLQSECADLGGYDRHSSTLQPTFEALKNKILRWVPNCNCGEGEDA